jgi:hypothetical protein
MPIRKNARNPSQSLVNFFGYSTLQALEARTQAAFPLPAATGYTPRGGQIALEPPPNPPRI